MYRIRRFGNIKTATMVAVLYMVAIATPTDPPPAPAG